MTRAVDRLPGVRTTAPSDFSIQAEVGASFPNPNTRNEVFVDDMEGVRDAVAVDGAERWRWSSVPRAQPRSTGTRGLPCRSSQLPGRPNAEVHWYSPTRRVKEIELEPDLTDAQGARTAPGRWRSRFRADPTTRAPGDTLWVGLTYLLDPVGIDLSRSQFIELWVNDFSDYQVDRAAEPRIRRPSREAPHRPRHGERGPDACAEPAPERRAGHRGPQQGQSARRHQRSQRGHRLRRTPGSRQATGQRARLRGRRESCGPDDGQRPRP